MKDKLPRAASIIESGWCQGALALDVAGEHVCPHSGDAVQWCILGAVRRAGLIAEERGEFNSMVKEEVGMLPEYYNDALGRTQGEVVSLLRRLGL